MDSEITKTSKSIQKKVDCMIIHKHYHYQARRLQNSSNNCDNWVKNEIELNLVPERFVFLYKNCKRFRT